MCLKTEETAEIIRRLFFIFIIALLSRPKTLHMIFEAEGSVTTIRRAFRNTIYGFTITGI